MRLAIPVWREHVSPVFDVAGTLLVIDVEHGREAARRVFSLGPPNEAARADLLAALGVDVLVCGVLSRPLEQRVTARGTQVVSLVSGPVERIAGMMIARRRLPPECLMPGHGRPRVRGKSCWH
jgi:predicted Fe-Mo cluster-binding NifX family protein